ncbi:hypothetical protein AB0P05_26680 [Streptomyces flaveolus]|uniref:hypothetical protein n=1 Tax=Streptomyces flaveolus TaxID=67297 RepID=UPI0034278CD0
MSLAPICAAVTASCLCILRADRCDGRHLCACGGSWRNDANSREDILLLPISWTLSWAETIKQSDERMAAYAAALEET